MNFGVRSPAILFVRTEVRLPRSLRYRVFIALAVAPVACQSQGSHEKPDLCTASSEPAILVEVRDAVTADPVADSARGVVVDGTFVDSLRPDSAIPTDRGMRMHVRRAADERPGTYTIELRHPRYEPWDTSGVLVTSDECHVRTQYLRAMLRRVEPTPGAT